jgi:hypothetical protein
MLAYPVGSEASTRVRIGVYLDALDDIPAWALSLAIRAWNRGDVTGDHNFSFAPAPAILRRACVDLVRPLRSAILHLEALRDAKPNIDEAMEGSPQAPRHRNDTLPETIPQKQTEFAKPRIELDRIKPKKDSE